MNPDSFSGQPRQHIYDFNPREALARLGEVVWFVSHQALKNGLIDKHMFLTTPPVRCTTLSVCFCERLENGTHTWLELWFVVECGLSVKHMHEHLQVDRECFYSLPPGREWPECPTALNGVICPLDEEENAMRAISSRKSHVFQSRD